MTPYLIRKQRVSLAMPLRLLRLPCMSLRQGASGHMQSRVPLARLQGGRPGSMGGPPLEPCPSLPGASWGLRRHARLSSGPTLHREPGGKRITQQTAGTRHLRPGPAAPATPPAPRTPSAVPFPCLTVTRLGHLIHALPGTTAQAPPTYTPTTPFTQPICGPQACFPRVHLTIFSALRTNAGVSSLLSRYLSFSCPFPPPRIHSSALTNAH